MEVAVLYEDWETGIRAKLACDQLEQSMTPDVKLSLELWRFDLLEEHSLLSQAARAASQTNLVLISAHGHRLLPPAIGSWLQQWLLQKRDEPSALILSLDLCHKDSSIASLILESLAPILQAAQVELFSHFGHVPSPANEPAIKAPLLPLSDDHTSSIPGARPQDAGHLDLDHRQNHR